MSIPADFLGTLPDRVAGIIAIALPGLADCRGMAGALSPDSLKRQGAKAPAVLVTRLALRPKDQYSGPLKIFTLNMAAFVLTRSVLGLDRDVAAGTITQALLALVPDHTWGARDWLGAATAVAAEPIVTAATETAGIGLAAVTWSHDISFVAAPDALPITPALYLGQAPRIGAAFESDYDLIGDGQ